MTQKDRFIKMRLGWFTHVEDVTGKVAKTCRYYGISRKTYYKWYGRYKKFGSNALNDQSRGPKHSPRRTPRAITEKILYLRKYYHFGPHKIQMYLSRYHDINITSSTTYRILRQNKVGRLPENMRYKKRKERYVKYEKPLPGNQLQVDVKFLAKIPGKRKRYYQYTAIDDCTRVRVLRIYDKNNQKTAIQFIDFVLSKLPFKVAYIQTDNGAEFQQLFRWHVQDKGIIHRYIKPKTPRLNGKVERSHRIDNEEFYKLLDGVVISSVDEFNERLDQWETYYNYQRPHGSLGGETPYERLKNKLNQSVT